jgi:hypothetical protein
MTRLRAEAFCYLASAVNPSAGEGPAIHVFLAEEQPLRLAPTHVREPATVKRIASGDHSRWRALKEADHAPCLDDTFRHYRLVLGS